MLTGSASHAQGAGSGADDFSAFVEFSRGIAESPRPRCREEEEQRVRSLSHPGPRTLEGTGIDVDFSAFEDFSRGRSDQRSDAAPDSDQAGGESAVVAGSCFGNEGAATNGKEPLSSEHGAGGDDAGQAGREGSVGAVAGTRRSAVEMEASRSQGHAATEALQVTPISFLKDSEVEHGGAAVDANEIQVALRSASGVDEGGQGLTGNGQHQGSNSGVDQYLSSAPQRRVLSRTSLDFPSRSSTDAVCVVCCMHVVVVVCVCTGLEREYVSIFWCARFIMHALLRVRESVKERQTETETKLGRLPTCLPSHPSCCRAFVASGQDIRPNHGAFPIVGFRQQSQGLPRNAQDVE